METTIIEVNEDGLEIALMDGSEWQLANIGDITKACLWYPTQRIKIEKNNKGEYTLTNLDTSTPDKIKALPLR
jgi:hypothetical protein